MSNDTDTAYANFAGQDVVISHYFIPGFTVETGPLGEDPILAEIEFFDSQQDSLVKYEASPVPDEDISRVKAAEWLDAVYPQMVEACKAIAAGETVTIGQPKPILQQLVEMDGLEVVDLILAFFANHDPEMFDNFNAADHADQARIVSALESIEERHTDTEGDS